MSNAMNHVRVLFFATLRDRAGMKLLETDLEPAATVRDKKIFLAETNPNLREPMKSVLTAINHEFAFDETIIPQGAEIAMFPPVSGG